MERRRITSGELDRALESLQGWKVEGQKISKTFTFGSFAEAIGWMVAVAIYADKLDHHPDWSNGYNRVVVDLTTHDMAALSTYDLALAEKMEELASN